MTRNDQDRLVTSILITVLLYIPVFFLLNLIDFGTDIKKSTMNPVYVELVTPDTFLVPEERILPPEKPKEPEPTPEPDTTASQRTPQPDSGKPRASVAQQRTPLSSPEASFSERRTYYLSGEPALGPRWLIEERPQSDVPLSGLEEYVPKPVQGQASDSRVVLGEAVKNQTDQKQTSVSGRQVTAKENAVPYDQGALDAALAKAKEGNGTSTSGSEGGVSSGTGKSSNTGKAAGSLPTENPFTVAGSGTRKWRPSNISQIIEEALTPYVASFAVSIRLTVVATLDPGGRLKNLTLTPSTGNLSADEALKNAIMNNLRFDPLPEGIYEEPKVTITYEIIKKR